MAWCKKLDRRRLPNWNNLRPAVMQMLGKLDPGNQFMVPWLGGAETVGYNVDKVKAALGSEPIPANPFELVFNPTYTNKLKACGISLLDSPSDVFPSALIYLGKRAYSNASDDYAAAAAAMLQKVRADSACSASTATTPIWRHGKSAWRSATAATSTTPHNAPRWRAPACRSPHRCRPAACRSASSRC